MWNRVDSQDSISHLLTAFGGFHDACLREVSVATETYVGEDLGMACPSHLDTSVLLFLQRQAGPLSAIEIECREVTLLQVRPSADGCDSIIMGGGITIVDGRVRLALNFVGGQLKGPPRGVTFIPARSHEHPDVEIAARYMAWRSLDNGLGNGLRYRGVTSGKGT